MATRTSLNLHQKLLEVRKSVDGLAKDATNLHHKFDYVSSSNVLGALRSAMNEQGLLLVPRVTGHNTEPLGKRLLTHIDMTFTWVDVESGETLECPWYAQGADSGELGPGKAYTYSEKCFLLKFFNIPTDKDDPDGSKGQTTKPTQTKQAPAGEQEGEVCPSCGSAMKKRKVVKEGPNKGKWFWSCPKNCKDGFKWYKEKKEELPKEELPGDTVGKRLICVPGDCSDANLKGCVGEWVSPSQHCMQCNDREVCTTYQNWLVAAFNEQQDDIPF